MNRILTAMRHDLVVLERDDGTWTTRTPLGDRRLECVAADSRRPDRWFVGTFENGLYRTVDGGDTFERVGQSVIDPDAVMSIAIDPRDPADVWVGTEPSAIFRSTDGGDTWHVQSSLEDVPSRSSWSFPPRPHTHHVRWIEHDPTDPSRIFVGIEAGALLRSTDGGETWEDRPPGSRIDNHTLATHPDAAGRVYAAAGDGYAESTDGGATWHHPQEGLEHRYVWGLAVDANDPDITLVSAANSASDAHRTPGDAYLYRRTSDGTWDRLEARGLPTGSGANRVVLTDTGTGGAFVAAGNDGVYHTTDHGEHWHQLASDWPLQGADTARGIAVIDTDGESRSG